jgi:molybdopterin molybdotransferase
MVEDAPVLRIDEARAAVLERVVPLGAETVGVDGGLDRVLAAEVRAAGDVPAFANSAMDGFALRSGPAGRRLRLVGESRAGHPFAGTVGEGEAVRISTGGALPDGADAVLQLELVAEDGGAVLLEDDVAPGRNVRAAGEDVREGDVVLAAGTVLGPAELAVAANLGRAELEVARRPRVALVMTGDELVAPGAPLGPGQVHESNSTALAALAARAGADVVARLRAPDEPAATEAAIAEALGAADMVLLTGGVSVGPHDHVKPALDRQGVEQVFWRVALRPGRPTWFGVRGDRLVLGLPGNPVSAMVTFLLFARPALLALQGAAPDPRRSRAALAVGVARQPGRDEAVRVTRDADGRVTPTGPQGSHVLTSMLGADGLAIVPAGDGELPAGTPVELLEP